MAFYLTRDQRRDYDRENARRPLVMTAIPNAEWRVPPGTPRAPTKAWRSRHFLAQLFDDQGFTRLSVNRVGLDGNGRWQDGITWDELQRVKSECGFGDCWAIELYPPDDEVVNDANMRHLWICAEVPACAWRR